MTCGNCGDDGSEAFFSHIPDQTGRKCLVQHCPNTSDQGSFLGMLCIPCAHAIQGEREPIAASRILKSIWPFRGLEES